jgi:hypothetical protein
MNCKISSVSIPAGTDMASIYLTWTLHFDDAQQRPKSKISFRRKHYHVINKLVNLS